MLLLNFINIDYIFSFILLILRIHKKHFTELMYEQYLKKKKKNLYFINKKKIQNKNDEKRATHFLHSKYLWCQNDLFHHMYDFIHSGYFVFF